jgi:hypothetical protein
MTTYGEPPAHDTRGDRHATPLLARAFTYAPIAVAQYNGHRLPASSVPFAMTQVAPFRRPWRIAILPDGRILVTEQVGALWPVTPHGVETRVGNVPRPEFLGMTGSYVVRTAGPTSRSRSSTGRP